MFKRMKQSVLVLLTCACVFWCIAQAAEVEQDDDDVHKNVAKEKLHWKPTVNHFYKKSYREKRKHLGHKIAPFRKPTERIVVKPRKRVAHIIKRNVPVTPPASFDARTNWPFCSSTISDVRDQGNCGACWAHATASVISDLICIQSAGNTVFKVSTQDQITCMPAAYIPSAWLPYTDLCQGFDSQLAMRMFINQGFVSGGEHNQATLGCMPYTEESYQVGKADINTCQSSCSDSSYSKSYATDKIIGTGNQILIMGSMLASWGLSGNSTYNVDPATGNIKSQDTVTDTVENLIMDEIMTNGPVTAAFDCYNDFPSYSSGVYEKLSTATLLGGHSVKLIGWGTTTDSVPYWLGVNSWNTSWGEDGFFRILRGSNHCNIESYIVTATAT